MKQGIRYIYIGMLILGMVLILLCAFFTSDKTTTAKLNTMEPSSVNQITPEEKSYIFDVGVMAADGLDVVFYSHHQFVRVLADGQEIYSMQEEGGIWGHTCGSTWNFITIPNGSSKLEICLRAAYKSVAGETHTFYVGDKLDIYKQIFRSAIPATIVSVILIILGIVMALYGMLVGRQFQEGRGMFYLGVFAALFGLWSFNELDTADLLYDYRIASSFAAYIYLMMLSSSFLLFARELIQIEEQRVWRLLCYLSAIELLVCLGLQFAGIADLKRTAVVTHIVIIAVILYIIVMLAYKIYKGNVSKGVKVNLVALSLLIIAAAGDIAFYYFAGSGDVDVFGRFIFLFFILVFGSNTLTQFNKVMEKGRKSKIYEELAITDILTGLRNRNAYESDVLEAQNSDGMMIIIADLNNLKKCNDTFGHSEGDNCIRIAADIIERIFSSYGKCYRIGGDEFLILIKKGAKCPIKQLVNQLRLEEQKYNEKPGVLYAVHMAVGYSIYDMKTDESFDSARDRADERMYENKKMIKGAAFG